MLILFGLILTICLALVLIQFAIEDKAKVSDSELAPVEAGFEKVRFSSFIRIPYFFVVVIYVLFDVELVIVYPIIFYLSSKVSVSINVVLLLIVIIITFLVEWKVSGLK